MVLTKRLFFTGCMMFGMVLSGLGLPASPVQANQVSPAANLPVSQITPTTGGIIGINGFPPDINPLTGLKVDDPSKLDRRPLLVKVSNYPRYSRPQAGLTTADMVFEYYIGEEANRFLAMFYGRDAYSIGPVRSGRLIDAQLTNMYGGILAYGNADPKVDNVLTFELGPRAIAFNDAGCPAICGKDTHSVAGVFSNSAELTAYAQRHNIDNNRPNLDGMLFEENAPSSNQFALNVRIYYSFRDIGEWHYDTATGQYLRWIESKGTGTPDDLVILTDRNNNQQVAFSNIVIIFAKYIEHAPTLHEIEIWNNSEGQRAILFRDGTMQEGEWLAPSHTSPMRFYNSQGIPLTLKPGNTWIVVAGLSSAFSQQRPSEWELKFALP